jgi:hypothetical protein
MAGVTVNAYRINSGWIMARNELALAAAQAADRAAFLGILHGVGWGIGLPAPFALLRSASCGYARRDIERSR